MAHSTVTGKKNRLIHHTNTNPFSAPQSPFTQIHPDQQQYQSHFPKDTEHILLRGQGGAGEAQLLYNFATSRKRWFPNLLTPNISHAAT